MVVRSQGKIANSKGCPLLLTNSLKVRGLKLTALLMARLISPCSLSSSLSSRSSGRDRVVLVCQRTGNSSGPHSLEDSGVVILTVQVFASVKSQSKSPMLSGNFSSKNLSVGFHLDQKDTARWTSYPSSAMHPLASAGCWGRTWLPDHRPAHRR